MFNLKNLKIRNKIFLIVAIVGLLVAILAVFANISAETIKEQMVDKVGNAQLQGYKQLIKWEVETIATLYGEVLSDVSDDKDKLQKLRELNNPVNFLENKSGYFFVYDKEGVNLSFPIKQELQGKNLINLQDRDGVRVIEELRNKAVNGGGFVQYMWQKKGFPSDKKFPKLSYSTMIPGTEWWIGAGVYIDDVDAEMAKASKEISTTFSKFIWIGFWITLGYTVLFVLPGVIVLSNMIIKPLVQLKDVAQSAEKGDFSVDVTYESEDEVGAVANAFRKLASEQRNRADIAHSIAEGNLMVNPKAASEKDVLGNALVAMTEKLNTVMHKIKTASVEVDSKAKQVAHSSESLSDGATKSAASIEEISSSMTEIESQVKMSSENATQANQLATSARNAAETGSTEMNNMLSAMDGISESSQKIAKIIKVIDDIAFQTNLLALNAAVEAARAGQHGKGFAVVAEEVRSLAGRSAKAAKETADLIEESVSRVDNGNNIAAKTGSALSSIVEQITKVTDLVGEIASASKEQAIGVSQVSQGLEQIDSVTQANTASAEETASASEELSAQATELQRSIALFKIKGNVITHSSTTFSERTKSLPTKPDTSKQLSTKVEHDEWGGDSVTSFNSNEDIISLDDDNFGKY